MWAAKRAALELLCQVPLTPSRQAALDAYRAAQGVELELLGRLVRAGRGARPGLAALARAAARRPRGPGRRGRHRRAAEFHAWVQWLVDEQLAAAQDAARAAGMATGIIHDLAVGVHPGGADAWAHQDLLVQGISVGAPPDSFNQLGQNWSQPPWHPQRLAAAGYRPLAGLFAAALRHAGGLRVDHVMGLARLWWVPEGMTADHGAYVRYDRDAAVAALAGRAAAAGAVAIGEDLGTVEEGLPAYLAEHGILGTDGALVRGRPGRRPAAARRLAARLHGHGRHPRRAHRGRILDRRPGHRPGRPRPPDPARSRKNEIARRPLFRRWSAALAAAGLVPPGGPRSVAEFTVALYGYLARTPALLVGVSLADAVGDTRSQNIPGTVDEYPNWRVPLCDDERPCRCSSRTCPATRWLAGRPSGTAGRCGRAVSGPPPGPEPAPGRVTAGRVIVNPLRPALAPRASRSRQRSWRAMSSRSSLSSRRSDAGGLAAAR